MAERGQMQTYPRQVILNQRNKICRLRLRDSYDTKYVNKCEHVIGRQNLFLEARQVPKRGVEEASNRSIVLSTPSHLVVCRQTKNDSK